MMAFRLSVMRMPPRGNVRCMPTLTPKSMTRRSRIQPVPAAAEATWLGQERKRTASAAAAAAARHPAFEPRAVRSMPIRVISLSRGGSGGVAAPADSLCEVFCSKVKQLNPSGVTEQRIPANPRKRQSATDAIADEMEKIEAALTTGTNSRGGREFVVLLDERGRPLDEYSVAETIAEASDDGYAGLAFVIGGPHGLHKDLRRKYKTISLSKLVLNHHVARVVLLEQLYRGYAQLAAHPYHHT